MIGRPLSPYAVTKYLNELYADVFGRCYSLATVGLRYFNVFGARQDPEGAYAAVIPVELTTDRLLLRQWREEDAEPLHEIYEQPEFLATMPSKTLDETRSSTASGMHGRTGTASGRRAMRAAV